MKIDRALIDHVALLARIELSDEEARSMTEQLARIVGYVELIETVATDEVPPLDSIVPVESRFRPDEETPSLPAADVFRNANRTADGFFLVPRIVGAVDPPGEPS